MLNTTRRMRAHMVVACKVKEVGTKYDYSLGGVENGETRRRGYSR